MDFDSLRYADEKPKRFSEIEIRDIVISILALSLAFFIMYRNTVFIDAFKKWFGGLWVVGTFAVMLLLVTFSFFIHEMGHKFTAQRMGLWSEYRMFPMGLIVAVVMSFVGLLFAAPGVVYIRGYATAEQDGKISLAGPATNMALSIIGLIGCFVFNGGGLIMILCYMLFVLNAALALFNMLPIGILDGSKIMRWDTAVWLVFFIVSVLLFLGRYLLTFTFSY